MSSGERTGSVDAIGLAPCHCQFAGMPWVGRVRLMLATPKRELSMCFSRNNAEKHWLALACWRWMIAVSSGESRALVSKGGHSEEISN
jgi:hypothetical protein